MALLGDVVSSNLPRIVGMAEVLGRLFVPTGLFISQLCVGISALLLWKGSGLTPFRAAYFMLGAYQTNRILTNAQAKDLAPSKNMGVAYGLVETAGAVAIILGPPIAGVLYSYNPTLPYSVSAILIGTMIGIKAFFQLKRKTERR